MAKIESPGISPDSFLSILGVTYFHTHSSDGGDLYLTRFGLPLKDHLETENWNEKKWFTENRTRLEGTSSVFRVPTKPVNGTSLDLVVKNCRVGEDVPLDTHTLMEFMNAEFNSPWEEFSLVMELRTGTFGPEHISIKTQEPLAIYVPPQRFQIWQTGRSRTKINRIIRRHPGISLDILRQYKLIYRWIEGKNIIETLEEIDPDAPDSTRRLTDITADANADMNHKGFAVADMKPEHIIIDSGDLEKLEIKRDDGDGLKEKHAFVDSLMRNRSYSIIDYELLLRTPLHEQEMRQKRRHSYLDHQRDRFKAPDQVLPPNLQSMEIFGVPYVLGHAESTGGLLWVVGKDPDLFDFFLPERWRRTPSYKLSEANEVFYTYTKDNIHLIWKTSRVGEKHPGIPDSPSCSSQAQDYGFNSPFEEFAIAHALQSHGIPTVYIRAIYMTGSKRSERVIDRSRYRTHHQIRDRENQSILRRDRNYITLRGYYNGPDAWVAEHESSDLFRPMSLFKAREEGFLSDTEVDDLYSARLARLRDVGYDGKLLRKNDLLVTLNSQAELIKDNEGLPEVHICNFELIRKITSAYEES